MPRAAGGAWRWGQHRCPGAPHQGQGAGCLSLLPSVITGGYSGGSARPAHRPSMVVPEKRPWAESPGFAFSRRWQLKWGHGQDTAGISCCTEHPLLLASRAQQHPETTGNSHLTSASGAKLTLRKHLLKEGREVLQGTEVPGPMPGGPHHETASTQGLSFLIWTIKGLG